MQKNKPKKGFPITRAFTTMAEIDAYFDTDKLTCLLCGGEYISLHVHVRNSHGMTAEDYKAEYGIPWQRGLISKSHKEKQARIMNEQRAKGILPQCPPPSHMKKLRKAASENRRPIQKAVSHAISQQALKSHGRTRHWGEKDFEEFLRRIGEGRTITEVGKDKDMPCRELFDEFKRENPDFDKKFWDVWEALPFDVQVRGQKTGKRFKIAIVKLRHAGKTWPEIAKELNVNASTPCSMWHRLKISGELDQYL